MEAKTNVLVLRQKRIHQLGERPFWISCRLSLSGFWIGVYWRRLPAHYPCPSGHVRQEVHLYVCPLPCFPIHVIWASRIE